MKHLTALLLSTVAAASLTLTGPTAHADPRPDVPRDQGPKVVGDCTHLQTKPRRITGACGDGNYVLEVRTYGRSTMRELLGTGVLRANTCEPSCAEGTYRRYEVTFGLRKPVTTADGTRVFSRLDITWVPDGEQENLHLRLPTAPVV
jgi:hypothetical protein